MTFVAALIAHQGGWDEVALVGTPIVLIIGLLALAKRRVDRIQHDPAGAGGAEHSADDEQIGHRRRD